MNNWAEMRQSAEELEPDIINTSENDTDREDDPVKGVIISESGEPVDEDNMWDGEEE